MSEIEVRHLSKTFTQKDLKVDALSDINLTVEKGDIYGIIGMSGAGKSTLVRCLNFLEKPTEGQVFIEGRELGSMDEKQLRKQRMKRVSPSSFSRSLMVLESDGWVINSRCAASFMLPLSAMVTA